MSFSTIPAEVWDQPRREVPTEPDLTRVPYYRHGRPRPDQLARYWQARALRAEAESRMWRELEQIRERNKER